MVRYDMVRYTMVQYGTVWYGTVWYGTVRYGSCCPSVFLCEKMDLDLEPDIRYWGKFSSTDLRQGVSYSDDFSLTVLTKFCTSNSNSKIF